MNEHSMNSFEGKYKFFFDKYKDYVDLYNEIYDLTPDKCKDLGDNLIRFSEEGKWDSAVILCIIAFAAECNLKYLREYWQLFLKIYEHFKINPCIIHPSPIPRIIALYMKQYNVEFGDVRYNSDRQYLNDQKYPNVESILNVYEPGSIMNSILEDDFETFKVKITEYDISQKILDKTIIEWCCYYGSFQCFNFLFNNNVVITKQCLDYSFFGRNKSIISKCLEYIEKPNFTAMKQCIQTNNLEYLKTFHTQYKFELHFMDILLYMNFPAFLYSISVADNVADHFSFCIFGIPDLITDILSLCGDINAKNFAGWTALFCSSVYNAVGCLKILLELGASKEEADNKFGDTALLISIRHGATHCALELINHGANIKARNASGSTALHVAASSYQASIIPILLQKGLLVDELDNDSRTPLFEAVLADYTEGIEMLLTNGASKEAKDINGDTPFLTAVLNDCHKAADVLIKYEVNVSAINNEEETAFLYALNNKDFKLFNLLIEKCTELPSVNNEGNPLHAASCYFPEFIRPLVDKGADIEAIVYDDDESYTPLMAAALNDNVESISILLELGAKLEKTAHNGFTALHWAANNGCHNAILKLIEKGANLEAKMNNGATPLIVALGQNPMDIQIVRDLIKAGANLEAQDNDGMTPLMHAIIRGNHGIIEELLNKNHNVNAQNIIGNTALIIATNLNDIKSVKELIKHGACVNITNNDGEDALTIAIKQNFTEIASELTNPIINESAE